MCPKLFSLVSKRKLFSNGKSRGPLLARAALNKLICEHIRLILNSIFSSVNSANGSHFSKGFRELFDVDHMLVLLQVVIGMPVYWFI